MPAALEEQKEKAATTAARAEAERAITALAALAEGKPAEAVGSSNRCRSMPPTPMSSTIWTISKLRSGDWEAAVKGLTFINSREARAGLSATTAYVYATLARVQLRMGQVDEARKSYQRFLDLFKDADPDLPLLVEVKAEPTSSASKLGLLCLRGIVLDTVRGRLNGNG